MRRGPVVIRNQSSRVEWNMHMTQTQHSSRAFPMQHTQKPRFRAILVAVLGISLSNVLVFTPQHATAQGRTDQQSTGMQTVGHSGTQVLDPEPFIADDLGLSMQFPVGASVSAQRMNGQLLMSVSDDPASPTWTMQVRSLTASTPQSSATTQIDDLLRDLKTAKRTFDVLSNSPFQTSSATGQLCYVRMNDQPDRVHVSGWLVMPTGANTFMVFAVQTLPEHLSRVRPLLEASFSTITLRSPDAIAAQKQQRFTNGETFLASLSAESLKALVGQSQWHRIYRPAQQSGTGELQEIGYSLVEVKEAKRGAINESRAEKDYTADERESGLLVRVQARLVMNAQQRDFYDSIAMYWMAWDQSSEVWSIIGTRRQGDAERSESETGIREAQSASTPRPVLRVIKRTETTEPVPYEWDVPPNYLSQALGWLVGRLLPRTGEQATELTFYYFVSSNLAPKVYQRVDRWSPVSGTPGQWVLSTQLTIDSEPFTSTYAADGSLIRRTHHDGTITEPIDLPALQKIWSARGLNVGPRR